MEDNGIYAQAKIEYTNQLIDILLPNIIDGFRSIYDESKIYSQKNSMNLVNVFRNYLSKIEDWGNQTIESETQRIIENSNCEWLDDLITAFFISRVKILTSINDNNNYNKINLTIPKTTNFIHKLYINISRTGIFHWSKNRNCSCKGTRNTSQNKYFWI